MKLCKILGLSCLLLIANNLFSQGMYVRCSSNKMFPNNSSNVLFNKIEFGGFAEFGDYRHKIGVMGGLQCYFINTWGVKVIAPVLCTYSYYFKDDAPSFFTKTGVGISIPGVIAPDYQKLRFSGFSAFGEMGYRFRCLEQMPNVYCFSISLGFDIQQARTLNAIYPSISKNFVFAGPSVSLRVALSN